MTIDFTIPVEMEPTLDLGQVNIPPLADGVANSRAAKVAYGSNAPHEQAYSDIVSGRENEMRDNLAALANSQRAAQLSTLLQFAQERKAPLDPEEIAAKFTQRSNPSSIVENNYAKEFVNTWFNPPGAQADDRGTWWQASTTDPNYAGRLGNIGEKLIGLQQVFQTGLEDAQAAYDQQSTLGYAVDLAKGLTQLYPEFKLRGGVTGADFALGLGTTLKNQRQAFWDNTLSNATTEYRAKLEALMKDNPALALEWAKAMKGMSQSDEWVNNIFTLAAPIDLYAGAKIGVDIFKGATTATIARTMAKEIVKAAPDTGGQTIKVAVADAVGMNPNAGIVRAANGLMDLKGTDQVKEGLDALQSALKADQGRAASRPGNYGSEVLNRINEAYDRSVDAVTNAVLRVSRVERIGDVLASEKVVTAAYQEIKDNYRSIQNNILQMNPVKMGLDGGYSTDIILGRADGSFFASAEEAQAFANLNNINISHFNDVPALRGKKRTGAYQREVELQGPTATGEVVGTRYYLALNKPLSETSNVIRDALITTGKAQDANRGWLNSLGAPAYARTPNEVLSKQEITNRIISVYASAIMKQVVANATKEIGQAQRSWKQGFSPKEIWKHLSGNSDFARFMDMSLKKVDPETGIPGYEWPDVPSVDTAFRQFIGRPAHPIEVEAYFAYQRGLAMDWSFRNLALYRNMRRVGAETHTIFAKDAAGNEVSSNAFVGIAHKQLPGRNDQASPILLMDDNGTRIYMSNGIQNSARGRAAAKALEKGEYKLIELYNRDLLPLKDFMGLGPDNNIKYVLTKNTRSRPLEFQQLPRQKGGHLVYDYNHYIKQADIHMETGYREKDPFYRYIGDKTVMPIENRLIGKDIVKGLDEVRLALRAGDETAAKAAATKLPIPYEDLKSWFYPKRGLNGEKIPARLSMEHPFYVVPKNKTIKDVPNDFSKFVKNGVDRLRDGTTSGSKAKQFQVEFTGERDAHEVFTITNDKGTRANPLYNYEPAKTIDPITVLNRSMSRIIDSLWMEDYKMSSMEHWLQEAISKDAINATQAEVRDAPFFHFMNTKLKDALPQETKQLLDAKRFMIKSFNGVPSNLTAYLDGVEQSMVDSIYGSTGVTRAVTQLGKFALTTTRNAPAFLRSVAYRADIGLFSIPQLIVQNMSYVTIFGVAGDDIGYNVFKGWGRAAQGTVGALLHQYSRINQSPEILQALDKIAQKVGYKPGHWLEARQKLLDSGFQYVGPESNIIMSTYHMEPRVVQSSVGRFLDAGDMFFKGGERNVKFGAWFTASLDSKVRSATGKMDWNQVLVKADDYAGNMTRASKSILQAGPMQFSTQFLGYQMRLAELFTGKRITNAQRARLLGTYALMYGVPVSATAVAFGLPINEQLKKYALQWGYVDKENGISNALMNGLPQALMQMATGNRYNFAERYGGGSFDLYRDVLAGDKGFMSIFSGAVGSLVTNSFEAIDPFWTWARSFINNDGEHIKLTSDALAGLLKTIASGNNALRLSAALGAGVWRSKNETPIKEGVSPLDAVMMSATGLQPMEATDARIIKDANQDQKKKEEEAAFKFTREFHRGLQAMSNRDFDNASQYFTNADGLLTLYHYPQEKRAQLLAQALDKRTMPDRLVWQYYLGRDVPAGQENARREQYQRLLRANQGQQ